MRLGTRKLRPMHVALLVASALYLIAATAKADTPHAAEPAAPDAMSAPEPETRGEVVESASGGGAVGSAVASGSFVGAVAGALLGSAVYVFGRDARAPQEILYCTAGGAVVGAGAGLIQGLASDEPRHASSRDSSTEHEGTVIATLWSWRY